MIPVLRTKLNRPPIPENYVPRTGLVESLEKRRKRPLTLVSAPAGYGKSTLASSWMNTCDCPNAWVSLDAHDNDLRLFMSCIYASVQTLFPGMGRDVQAQFDVPDLPPIQILARSLINELDRIGQDFILVLDDFHEIHEKSVLALLREMMKHPPQSMHLVLISRKDPFLPISYLRALDLVTEVRTHDLRFSDAEVIAFLKTALGDQIEEATAMALAKKTEGWVTGLRLAVLALRGKDDVGRRLSELTGTTRYVMDYLISEVLENQPPAVSRLLLSMSILDRFCPSLCDVLCESCDKADLNGMNGDEFIARLQNDNVFLIALDNENRWFRYHHLLRDLLQKQMKRRFSSEKIAALHTRASEWFEGRELIEESIDQAIAANDTLGAAKIIERNRHAALDEDRWHSLQRWLNRLPAEMKQVRPELLLSKAWILLQTTRIVEIKPVMERVKTIVDEDSAEPTLFSEINFFWGLISYFKGESLRSLEFFCNATALLPEGFFLALKSEAEYWYCVALHLNGQKEKAIRRLNEGIISRDTRDGMMLSRLIFGLGFIRMLENESVQAFQAGRRLTEISRFNRLAFAETWGMYVQGNASFQMFDLEAAHHHFSLVAKNRYTANQRAAVDAMAGLAITFQFMGKPDEADETMILAEAYAEWTKQPLYFDIVRSCRTRIALMRGDIESAARWQRSFGEAPGNPIMLFFLENPAITECRVLIALGTGTALEKATHRLNDIYRNAKTWHSNCQMTEILVLQSLASQHLGRSDKALKTLEPAVNMAMSGESIRPFIEAGMPMADLLKKLFEKKVAVEFIEKIIAAFPQSTSSLGLSRLIVSSKSSHAEVGRSVHQDNISPSSLSVDPLSNRELDVLELLAQRLRNKEIAEKLFISPETVRTHLQNIYQKIHVCNRRQAVARAVDIGVLISTSK